jgi:hypothetical protein
MSVRLRLEATSVHPALESPEAFLEHVTPIATSAIRAFGMPPVLASSRNDDSAEIQAMCFRGFEPLILTWLEPGRVKVEARTAAMGPGYHQHLCDHVLPALAGPLSLRWTNPHPEACYDEAGYFFDRDREALEGAHLGWLRDICEHINKLAEENRSDIQLAMPLNPRFATEEFLVTPQGPRSAEWAAAVSENPESGRDFFTWWDAGETPAARLGVALWLMWSQVAWRPALDDDDAQINELALRLIEEAHRDDPGLDCPWEAWTELANHAGKQAPEVPKDAESAIKPIGYRRGMMWVDIVDGWRLCIPGGMSMEIDDEGNWLARDQSRVVRFAALSANSGADAAVAPRHEVSIEDRIGRDDDLQGEAYLDEDGLHGSATADGRIGLLSVHFKDSADREWAVETWHSLGVTDAA